MNKPYFRQLLEEYILGQTSDSDKKQFFDLLEQEGYRSELEQILQAEWDENAYEEPQNEQLAGLIEQFVLQKIKLEERATPKPLPFFRRYRLAAAAVLLSAIAGITWLYSARNHRIIPETLDQVAADIPSGINGAVLTLDNGRQIVLDSAGNGVLTRQGTTTIVKQGDRLAYTGDHLASASGIQKTPAGVVYNTVTTPRARQFPNLVLADGTKVWLDAGSSIRFPVAFSGKERKVEVTGQVWFDVVHNEKMPFRVMAGGIEISDLGTQFNVNAYSDENDIRITLLQGAIRLGQSILKPGQQARIPADGTMQIIDNVNTADVIAWKNGFFSFRSTDVKGIMRQLSRWYDVDVQYEGVDPKGTFTGKIDRNLTLAQVLKVLESARIHFRIEQNRKLIIMP